MTDALDPTPVQLTRIEGKIDLVVFQLTDHAKTLERHEGELRAHNAELQRLASEAVARDQLVEKTASALKDAKDAEDAVSRRKWTPVERGLTLVVLAVSLLSLYQYVAAH